MAPRLTLAALVLALAACATGPSSAGDGPPSDGAADLLALQAQAEAAYVDGRHADAASLYTALAKARPLDADYWYRLANALVRTGSFADAGFAYRQVVTLEPGHGRAWHNLGRVHMHLAQESLAEAVRQAGGDRHVLDESLRLSASLYSLVGQEAPGRASEPTPGPEAGRQP